MGRITVIQHNRTRPERPALEVTNPHESRESSDVVNYSLASKIRVAAYCRVSTLQEEQDLSFESQQNYYKTLIESNSDFYLVEIYGDHGKSGLNAEGRPGFQRMIRDCRNGRIDRIYTRSISRFARNAAECLEYINELRRLGVIVHFEKESFNTADSNIDMILSFLAILAQEEVNSLSQAIIWSHKKRNRAGDPIMAAPYGYTRDKKPIKGIHHWHINEREAIRVRKIYELYLEGLSYPTIAREMTKFDDKHGNTRKTWTSNIVKRILTSEKYVGDILTNKQYKPDYTKKKTVKNGGEREQQYIKDHHPAIISREDKQKVEKIMEANKRWIQQKL